MTYTLNSGIKNTAVLSPKQIEEWIDCFKNGNKYVTVIGREYLGLNPELIADFKVHNEFSEQRNQIEAIKIQVKNENLNLEKAYNEKRILAKVDCRMCNTIYVGEILYKSKEVNCTKCKSKVYLDALKGMLDTGKGKAYYYTNIKEEV
jgi:DNA-directed RNA polymerase subunit RPC12/RpoP